MPVSGLPSTLECIINNLLQETTFDSYKVAGNQHRTTLVLRFDNPRPTTMANTGVLSTQGLQSTPVNSPRRQSKSEDLLRHNQHKLRCASQDLSRSRSAPDNDNRDPVKSEDCKDLSLDLDRDDSAVFLSETTDKPKKNLLGLTQLQKYKKELTINLYLP